MPLAPSALDEIRDGPVTLDALAADAARLELWIDEHRRLHAGTDRRAAGAFLIGRVAFEVLEPLAQRLVARGRAPIPGPGDVALRLGWSTWEDEGGRTPVLALRPRFAGAPGEGGAAALGAALHPLFAALVAALAGATRLSSGSLWRLVTDAVASTLLEAGRAAGQSEAGMALAHEALAAADRPLRNPQCGFFELRAADRAGRPCREWHLRRGGCCRFYTVEGGETCTSCVLRDQASREARLRDWVASRPLPEPVPASA